MKPVKQQDQSNLKWVADFIWNIADDRLRDVYVRGKYRDVILPFTVLRRLDAVLESTKQAVLERKKFLDTHNVAEQDGALRMASGQAFYNTSEFTLATLTASGQGQRLRDNFVDYLDGFSPNVQDILAKFKFRDQIQTMVEADILGHLINDFLDPEVNLSPMPVKDADGRIKLPALDNHGMGTVFEELIRRFNEENNEEAGEHFTPRDVVKLMAKLLFLPVADDYDDPAFSGGNMERPALRRMMVDIEAGKIDVVVIYKIDRLTRSLADFSKMVEVFERYGVSFVSVTQQFNTTTSMGRLMLNILLSFAQFEREVTGERIRDKIAASKRKGMWMGGVPPLGYDVENRRLVPNEREAKLIRHIFQRFVELGSSTALVKELKLDGVTSKAWTTQDGKTREGRPIDKGHIYKLLSNRTYLGELRHKDQWYQAEHPPIISRELWDSAHAILATNGRVRGNATRATVAYLLKGIVFGNDGRALSPWHTTKKNGRRYRYYVPQRDAKEYAGASGLPRLPAAELESAVLDQLRAILRAPNLLGEMLPQAIKLDPTLDEAKITVAMTRLDAIWDQLFPAEQARIVKLLVEKVIVSPNDLEVRLRANGIERLVLELCPEPVEQQEEALA